MAIYTMKIDSVCTGGEHIGIALYRDAVKVGVNNNANTAAKRKTAIEGLQVVT